MPSLPMARSRRDGYRPPNVDDDRFVAVRDDLEVVLLVQGAAVVSRARLHPGLQSSGSRLGGAGCYQIDQQTVIRPRHGSDN